MKTHLLFTFVVSILINQAVYSQSQAIDFTLSSYTINIAENIQTSYNTSEDVSVTLNSQPSSNVTVTFNPTVFDQITITPTQLEFTPSNWNTPQTVEISAVSDGVNEGEFTVVKVDVKSSITIHDSGSGDGSHDSGSGDGSHDSGSGDGSHDSGSGDGSHDSGSGDGSHDSGSGDGSHDSGSGDGSHDSGSGDGSHDSGSGDGSHDSGSGDGSTDDGSTTYENTKLLTVNVYDDNSDELVYIRQSSLFQATTNAFYPYVFNAAKKLDGNNGSKITFKINITSLPNSGATYRVLKSVANGNTFTSSAKSLTAGLNTITIAGVSFDRFVKIQFSSGSIAFDSVILNGTTLPAPNTAPDNIADIDVKIGYDAVDFTVASGITDPDGDSISLIKVTTPANGTVSLTSAGDVIYSPNDNFYGADSFSFKISDGTNETTVTSVTIDVIGLSDLNGDGSVDTVDLTFLASHIVGIVGYELPASYENVFDVNQDGEINTIDLVYLASYIVGVEGYNLNIKD